MRKTILIGSFALLLIPLGLAVAFWPRLGPRVWATLDRIVEGPEDRFINNRRFKR